MWLSRKEKRQANRELVKNLGELVLNHDRQLIECGFWIDVVMTALKDAGILDDEKIEAAKKKVIEKLQEVQKAQEAQTAQKATAAGQQEEQ